MGQVAFVFPGQASQYPGMGKDLAGKYPAAKAVFNEADNALGFSISKICFEGTEEELKLTANTQPAILTCSVAVLRVLADKGLTPDFVAVDSPRGYSGLGAARAADVAGAPRIGAESGADTPDAGSSLLCRTDRPTWLCAGGGSAVR